MKKKTVKLVSAVVVLGVLCAAYEGVNFYVTSQEEKETEENDTSVDLVSLEADDITAVSFTADQNEVEFDKKDDSWTEKSDCLACTASPEVASTDHNTNLCSFFRNRTDLFCNSNNRCLVKSFFFGSGKSFST